MQIQAVIVGAGIGGLVAAIELARTGIQVDVFERAPQAGGKMRQVCVGGQLQDAGPTVLTMRWIFDDLFRRAGADLQAALNLVPSPLLGRHAWGDGARLDLYTDEARSAEAIGDFAGAAAARGYRAYCRYSQRLYEAAAAPFMLQQRPSLLGALAQGGPGAWARLLRVDPFRCMMQALHDYFAEPRLRQLFGRYATYCGGSPYHTPATLHLVAHVEQRGVWLLPGGMQALAQALVRLAQSLGVRLHFNQTVQRLLLRGDRVQGIVLADGGPVTADAVILAAEAAALTAALPGARLARPPRQALSALTFHVLAKTSTWPLARHNVFFGDDNAAEFLSILTAGRLPREPSVYVCAQDRDGVGQCATRQERLLCLVNAPAGLPALTPGERQQCTETMLHRLRACGLDLTPTAPMGLTTPADFASLFPGSGGALYGPPPHGWSSFFRRSGSRTPWRRLYLAGGSVHPGPGLPMVALGGSLAAAALRADCLSTRAVAPGGYAWWYVDGSSADGQHALTVIAFVGSVFSPYYAAARRRSQAADPMAHCGVNVAVYGPKGAWSFNEYGSAQVQRSGTSLRLGQSVWCWRDGCLEIDLQEGTAPWAGQIVGRLRLRPLLPTPSAQALDPAGRHHWWPVAPQASLDVALQQPDLCWTGPGYHDANWGETALESDFELWDWQRHSQTNATTVHYSTQLRGGARQHVQRHFGAGTAAASAPRPLPRSRWGLTGALHAAPGATRRDLEDTPFYRRSHLQLPDGSRTMHEHLDLRRFRRRWVQHLLRYRMRRVPGRNCAGGGVGGRARVFMAISRRGLRPLPGPSLTVLPWPVTNILLALVAWRPYLMVQACEPRRSVPLEELAENLSHYSASIMQDCALGGMHA